MHLALNTLEIRILLACNEKFLQRSAVSQKYHTHSKNERESAIDTLISCKFITALELPKPGANKTPVFYEITDKGKEWVKKYLDNYPKT